LPFALGESDSGDQADNDTSTSVSTVADWGDRSVTPHEISTGRKALLPLRSGHHPWSSGRAACAELTGSWPKKKDHMKATLEE